MELQAVVLGQQQQQQQLTDENQQQNAAVAIPTAGKSNKEAILSCFRKPIAPGTPIPAINESVNLSSV